jgi:hypothetical protein
MTKNLVVVDIDNTVHESDITMNRVSMELFNSPFRWCQQHEWYKGTDAKMPMENALQVFSRLHDRDMIFLTEPYVGSVEGLKRIADAGYEIAYYTDRKAEAHNDTHDWLVEYGFPNADNLFCCADKRGAIAEVADKLATIIDDRPRTIIFGRYELGLENVYSLKQPYNRNLTDIPGVQLKDTWSELVDTFFATMPVLATVAPH